MGIRDDQNNHGSSTERPTPRVCTLFSPNDRLPSQEGVLLDYRWVAEWIRFPVRRGWPGRIGRVLQAQDAAQYGPHHVVALIVSQSRSILSLRDPAETAGPPHRILSRKPNRNHEARPAQEAVGANVVSTGVGR